jgi:hypothetical protein
MHINSLDFHRCSQIFFISLIWMPIVVINDFFTFYYLIGFLVALWFRVWRYFSVFGLFLSLLILSLMLLTWHYNETRGVTFIFTHLLLITAGIWFTDYLGFIGPDSSIFSSRFSLLLLAYILLIAFFQFTGVLTAPHWPRVTSIFVNPNEMSAWAVFFVIFYANGLRNYVGSAIFFLGGSVALTPIALYSFSRRVKIIIIVLLFLVIYFVPVVYEIILFGLDKITQLFDGVFTETKVFTEIVSASRRVYYIQESIDDVMTFKNWFTLNSFQFREGALLSLSSINPMLALAVLLFSLWRIVLGWRAELIPFYFLIAIWLFITPVFSFNVFFVLGLFFVSKPFRKQFVQGIG